MARLVIVEGKKKGDFHMVLPGGLTIGRLSTNDLALPDGQVSRQHSRIEIKDGTYYIYDLGSKNGTSVNRHSITEKPLVSGDLIEIGGNVLRFEDEQSAKVEFREGGTFVPGAGTIVKPLGEIALPKAHEPGTGVKALEKSNRTLSTLFDVGRALLLTTELSDLLNMIMDLVFKELPAERGFLLLLDNETGALVPSVVRTTEPGYEGGITVSRTITEMVVRDRVSVLTADAATDPRFQEGASVFLYGIRSALCVPLWRDSDVIGVIYIDTKTDKNSFTEDDLDLLTAMANQAAIGIMKARLMEKARREAELRERLARYHSPDVVEYILKEGVEGTIDVAEQEVTVLFSDIKGFTTIAEKLEPSEVASLLNEHFTMLTDIVFEFGGTLDKYIGDSIMALFGAPLSKEDDAERAVRAALKMQSEMKELMDGRDESRRFDIRIGINTGTVVAGNIGSPRRMDYTVIGDAVNVAQRLESIAMPGQILIGGSTYRKVKDRFLLKEIGRQRVKGKDEEVVVYEVLG